MSAAAAACKPLSRLAVTGLLFAALLHRPCLAAAPAGPLAREVQDQLAAVEREVARLRQSGDAAGAEALGRQLAHFRDRLAGKAAPAGDGLELHVVGLYEGADPPGVRQQRGDVPPQGSAAVEVQPTGRPIVLVLCAYDPVKWDVRVGQGAKLGKVILSGYYDQEAHGIPAGIPIEKYTYVGKSRRYFHAHGRDFESYPEAARTIRELTGLPISTFVGTYRYKDKPFVIGPGDAEWEAQRILSDLRPVYLAAVAHERDRLRRALEFVRFPAAHQVRRGGLQIDKSWASFTPTGPIAETMRPLPRQAIHLALDPKEGTLYCVDGFGFHGHGLGRVDFQNGKVVPIKVDAALPEPSHVVGLTFDTRRRRAVLFSLTRGRKFYAYEPATGRWSILSTAMKPDRTMDLQSLAYSSEDDCLYGLCHPRTKGGIASILRFNPDGQVEREVPLSKAVPVGLEGFPPGSAAQLIAAGRHLVLLSASLTDPNHPEKPPHVRSFLIDPRTGFVTDVGPAEPHPAADLAVADEEFEGLWQSLPADDSLAADLAMWRLAAAGDRAVAFLRAKLPPLPKPAAPDAAGVRALVGKLDDPNFQVREGASRELRQRGSEIDVELEQALAAGPSPEVQARLKALLREVREGGPAVEGRWAADDPDPEARREQRAVLVLARVGTPDAAKLLRDLAAGPAGAPRTERAKAALRQVGG